MSRQQRYQQSDRSICTYIGLQGSDLGSFRNCLQHFRLRFHRSFRLLLRINHSKELSRSSVLTLLLPQSFVVTSDFKTLHIPYPFREPQASN